MSFGGRLTLVGSVLNSLPVYYFSHFRALPCVLNKLESVRRKNFWGGSGDVSKMSWVRWDDVIRPFEAGGLNLGSLKCKNWALIGKWWWRFNTESTSLWVKVIKSIYGGSGHLLTGGLSCSSSSNSLWLDIVKTCFKIDEVGIDFTRSMVRTIGNGNNTSFWQDPWLGNTPLKITYSRLFRLEVNQDAKVCDRVIWQSHAFVSDAVLARVPNGRTRGELMAINNMLQDLSFDTTKEDSWVWSLSGNGNFCTKILNDLIFSKTFQTGGITNGATLRNNLIPKEVEIFI
ncbi:uncharacterized mitochondrial protein AtMg00310-like [Rutidosis leptorrhynchoides]|uniref:uncharacterized mitochondrial protein AtMg00310-like n=1 Tax=Rutidosis leptorrhynchoides TaxID=125765 RepID=UPI003A997606